MGIDYSFGIRVGFEVSYDEFEESFSRKMPPRFHMEARFDPKTGKPVEPVRITDDEGTDVYTLQGVDYEDLTEFTEEFGNLLDCKVEVESNMCTPTVVWFSVKGIKSNSGGLDEGNVTCDAHMDYKSVIKAATAVETLRVKLIEHGMIPMEPKVLLTWNYG